MMRVRFRADLGFEGQCSRCLDWWPLDTGYWKPRQGLGRCLACIRETARVKNAARRRDPAKRAYEREALAMTRQANREAHLAARRDYYRKNRDHILAKRRAAHKAAAEAPVLVDRVARRKAYKRDWMRRHRAQIDAYYRQDVAA